MSISASIGEALQRWGGGIVQQVELEPVKPNAGAPTTACTGPAAGPAPGWRVCLLQLTAPVCIAGQCGAGLGRTGGISTRSGSSHPSKTPHSSSHSGGKLLKP